MSDASRVGVLLLTFGSAVTSADVPAYLRSVRGGREPSADLVAEFARRFDVIGRSPLIDITLEQAEGLERRLNTDDGEHTFAVAAGMLHSQPRVVDSLRRLVADGAERVVAIVLAPQYSPLILTGYERTLNAAAAEVAPLVPLRTAGAWHTTDSWIASLASRVDEALAAFDATDRDGVAIV
ncbi:MAG TPA: ferrochelatase, partial [Candidatus Deferrimicrobium sp.]|nr:ferrochelatase [Candidatus Deferrimicrobium sp.]